MKKSLFITLALLIQLAFSFVFSVPYIVPSGTGTSGDPYLIASYGNLQWVAYQVNSQNNPFGDKYLKQTTDIVIPDGVEWIPIGLYPNSEFRGNYNGSSHTISGITITNTELNSFGLFGAIGRFSNISNLGVINLNINVPSRSLVGGIAGIVTTGEIYFCYTTGSLSGGACVGGIAGTTNAPSGSSYLQYCYSTATVEMNNNYQTGSSAGNWGFGGLVGSNSANCWVVDCYSRGAVSGYSKTGGLVGYNLGSILQCYSTGAVTGTLNVGGLVGDGYMTPASSDFDQFGNPVDIPAQPTGAVVKYCFWDSQTSGKNQDYGPDAFPEYVYEMNSASFNNWGDIESRDVFIQKLGAKASTTSNLKTESTYTTLNLLVPNKESYEQRSDFIGWTGGITFETILWPFNSYAWQINPSINDGYPSFAWQPVPAIAATVTTKAASNITANSVTVNGEITNLGSANPTAYGFCYSISNITPTISDTKTDKGAASATGTFSASLTGLLPGTTYYLRSFATNTAGTSYGAVQTFKTTIITTTWNGNISGELSNTANWDGGNVPVSGNSIIIPKLSSGSYPDLGNFTFEDVTINGGAKASISSGNFVVNNNLIFTDDLNGVSQLLNNGTTTVNGKVVVRKQFKTTGGWYFVSFPFNVPASSIYLAGTTTQATWGDPISGYVAGKNIYIAEYDGQKRDATGSTATTNSPNWRDLSTHTLVANKGYIMAVDADVSLDFVSGTGEAALFSSTALVPVSQYITNSSAVHNSWNLVGNPFSSGYNMGSFSNTTFYFYNGSTYDVINTLINNDYKISPFGAYFMQASGNNLNFASGGRVLKNRAISQVNTDILNLSLSNDQYVDKTYVCLEEGASSDYVINSDAVKFFSPNPDVPQLYTKINNFEIAVNSLPVNTEAIDLYIKTRISGNYKLSLSTQGALQACAEIWLLDNETGVRTNLLTTPDYSFSSRSGESNRFKIILNSNLSTQLSKNSTDDIAVKSIKKSVTAVGFDGQATVSVYSLSGSLIYKNTSVYANQILNLNVPSGLYIVDVVNGLKEFKTKVLLQ